MIGESPISFREFVMKEPLPLGVIHDAVLEFLQHRDDAAVFGAHAVNAYVSEVRATQYVDILSPRAKALAEELRQYLSERFHIAARVREVRDGLGYRIYQDRAPEERRLVRVKSVPALPPCRRVEGIPVVAPEELIALKVRDCVAHRGQPRWGIDCRDLAEVLLRFPELKTHDGPVRERLEAAGANEHVLSEWHRWVDREVLPESDEDC